MSLFAATASIHRRVEWKDERDGIDLENVATQLLGPAPGRVGERGRKSWWCCPFHADGNPSFCVDPGKAWWRCYGCGEKGDAANLVMRLEGLTFPEAVARLVGGGSLPRITPSRSAPVAPRTAKADAPSGLPADEALSVVRDAERQLWSPDGRQALTHLVEVRRLTLDSIRSAHLGWTPGVQVPTQRGTTYTARGVVIPWFDGGRLTLAKIRQPGDSKPKYAELFRDRPTLYPGDAAIRPGSPLVAVEGEFDALLLGQELQGLATVVTLGSASGKLDPALTSRLLPASPWYVATDGDEAGDRAAAAWPARAKRVRPPASFKDWTEAAIGRLGHGVDLRRWWIERLAGRDPPRPFAWDEFSTWTWGPAASGVSPGPDLDGPQDGDETEAWPSDRE